MLTTHSLLLERLDQFLFWLAPQKRHSDYHRLCLTVQSKG